MKEIEARVGDQQSAESESALQLTKSGIFIAAPRGVPGYYVAF